MTFDDQMAEYESLQEEITAFQLKHAKVLDGWVEMIQARRELLERLTREALVLAQADAKTRGLVTVGPFSFVKKMRTTYNTEKLLSSATGLRLVAKHGLATLGFSTDDVDTLREAVKDVSMQVVLDVRRLKSLADEGAVILPEGVAVTTPMTPSFKKGPKPGDYDG